MATITTILGSDSPADSRVDINDNFAALNVEVVAATAAVATKAPTASPTFTGTVTTPNLAVTSNEIVAGAAMAALAIDVTKRLNTKTVSADSTLTFSATPTTGAIFGLRLTEGGGLARTITIPSCYSQARGATITSFTLLANATLDLVWQYDGSTYFIYNDFVTAAQQKTALGITISDVSDLTGELAGKAASTHSHTASEVTDFNSAARAQVEAELVAGSNITLTPSGTGASRQITIASSGGGGGTGTFSFDDGDAATDPSGIAEFDDGDATTD